MEGGVVADDELGAVGEDQPDPIALADTEHHQTRRESLDVVVKLAVGDVLAEEGQRRPVPISGGGALEEIGE